MVSHPGPRRRKGGGREGGGEGGGSASQCRPVGRATGNLGGGHKKKDEGVGGNSQRKLCHLVSNGGARGSTERKIRKRRGGEKADKGVVDGLSVRWKLYSSFSITKFDNIEI